MKDNKYQSIRTLIVRVCHGRTYTATFAKPLTVHDTTNTLQTCMHADTLNPTQMTIHYITTVTITGMYVCYRIKRIAPSYL